ncbi:hypothetical protein A0H81_07853 [Grifola frondosa]|uniref:Uncharacterized protein n=1 Tax=Grifola frondosa TaxID=5627 RepID=A0A1C7M666_GRIFR|nr:hypothetical protein A0H81_07853 [Grifola frondosa]
MLSRSQTQSRAVKSGNVGASGIELAHARRDLESNTGCGPVHEIGPGALARAVPRGAERAASTGPESFMYWMRLILPDLLGLPKKHKLSETDWSYNEDSTLSSKTAQSPNKRHRFSPSPKLVGGSSVPSRQFECRTPLRQQQIDRGHNSGEAMHTPHNLLPSFHEKLINSRPALLVPQPDLDFEPMIFDTSPGNDTYRITETPFYDGLGLLRSGIQAVSPSDRHLSSPNIEDSMGYSSLGTDSTRGSNILSTSPYSVFSGHSSLGVASTHPDSEASCWEGVVGDSDEGKCLTIGPADRSYTTPNTSLRRNKALHFAPGFLSDISVYSTDSEPYLLKLLLFKLPQQHLQLAKDLCPLVETADTIEQPLIEALQGQLFEGADPWRAIDKLLDLEATSQLCTDASEDAASSTHRCQSVGSAFLAMNGRSGVGHAAARADASEEELHLIYTNLTRVYEDNAQKDLSLEVIPDATHAEAQRYSLPKAYGSLQTI